MKNFFILLVISLFPAWGNTFSIIVYVAIVISCFIIKPDRRILKVTMWLIILLLVALINGAFHFSAYAIFKDLFYFLSPILFLLLGSIWAKKQKASAFFKSIIITGTLISLYHVITVFFEYGIVASFIDPRTARDSTGEIGYVITVITLLLLIASKTFYSLNLLKRKRLWIYYLLINVLSLYISSSRTNIMLFFVSCLVLYYPMYRHRISLLIKYSVAFVLLVVAIVLISPQSRFTEAILRTTEEVKIKDATDASEINDNYRGYEAFVTMKTYTDSPLWKRIVGQGFGAVVDMGFDNPIAIRFIPIMHNGYPYILLKVGLFGLLVFLIYIYQLFHINKIKLYKTNKIRLFLNFLNLSLLIGLCVINTVVTGFFNPGYTLLWVVCGASIQYNLMLPSKNNSFNE